LELEGKEASSSNSRKQEKVQSSAMSLLLYLRMVLHVQKNHQENEWTHAMLLRNYTQSSLLTENGKK
jgi:hypothetical protein